MDLGLRDRVALVTGGSSGLGFAVAKALLADGARVALNSRDAERLARAARRLDPDGTRVRTFPADVSDPASAALLVAEAAKHYGRLDILLCNAGGPPATTFANAPLSAWQDALDLNLLSAIHLCRVAVPVMRQARWGRIIAVASVAASQPLPGLILSTTARAGLLGFCKALSDEVAPEGITVNVVSPGFILTDRVQKLAETRAAEAGTTAAAALEAMARQIPAGRIGDPAEFAAAVAFLASERASYVTGTVLAVDGGLTRSIG